MYASRFRLRFGAATPAAVLLACALLLASCATDGGFGSSGSPDSQVAQAPGIGGTGDAARQPGIGGTGDVAQAPGIGGTGIIGTVTGFGSILVNGYEIDYPRGFAITRNGAPAGADDLRVGQVVEVEATGEGRRLAARRIAIRHDVVGPVERVDTAGGRLVVLGQRIVLEPVPGADAGGAAVRLEALTAGDMVEVSGLRRGDGSILASRIDRAPPGAPALVRGLVAAADAGGFTIGGLRIEADASSRPVNVLPGREAAVRGAIEAGRFRPNIIEAAPEILFGGRVTRLSVEGYLGRTPSGALGLGGVTLTRPAPDSRARPGDRVIMEGPLDARGRMAPAAAAAPGSGQPPPAIAPPPSRWRRAPDTDEPLRTLPPREAPRSDRAPPPANRR